MLRAALKKQGFEASFPSLWSSSPVIALRGLLQMRYGDTNYDEHLA